MIGYVIAMNINLSKTVIYTILKNPKDCVKKEVYRRQISLTMRQKWGIALQIFLIKTITTQIKYEIKLQYTIRAVRSVL